MFLFRLEIDHDNYKTLDNCKDVTLLASTLKLFFRELPEPIISKEIRSQVVPAVLWTMRLLETTH